MIPLPFQKYHIGQCLINCDDMSLSHAGNTINLPVKVFEFLKLLIVHPKQTVTKEMAIEQVWLGNIEVGKRGAGNAIWALRKAFTELGLDHEQTFKTITKVGYQLLVKPQGIETPVSNNAEQLNVKTTDNRRKILITVIILMTLSVLILLITADKKSKINVNKQAQRITSLEGIEEHPEISPDGHYMAFIWRAHLKKNKVYIRDLTNNDAPLRLLNGAADEQSSPSWSPDGQNVAYLNVNEQGQCSVHIHQLITNIDSEIAGNCAKSGLLKSLDWSNDGSKIAFARTLGDRIAVFTYHLESKTIEQLSFPGASEEDFLMRWHANSESLAFVRSSELHAEIRLNEKNTEQILVKNKEMILSLDWDKTAENLYFNNLEGGSFVIEKFNLKNKVIERFHRDSEIHSLSVSPATKELFYTRHVAQESIAVHSLTDGNILQTLQSSSRDLFGQLVPTTAEIMFLSNRSGNWEVWLKQADKNTQLTQSNIHGLISIPAVSPVTDQFVIAMRRPNSKKYELYLGELPSGEQTKLLDIDGDVRNPSYSADGKRLYFSAKTTGKWSIYRYTFTTKNLQVVAENNGKYAIEDEKGGIFFSKDNTQGIFYLSTNNRESLITKDLSSLDWGSMYYQNQVLYFIKRTEKFDFIVARDNAGVEQIVMTLPPITIRNEKAISPGMNDSIIFTLQGINDSDIYKIAID